MLLLGAAALVGATVQSATGFGFALVLSPALLGLLEPHEAVLTMLTLATVLNALVLFESGRPEHVDWRRLAPLLAAAIPGLAAGALLLAVLSKEVLQVAVGVAVIAAGLWQLRVRRSGVHPRRVLPRGSDLAAGFASGTLTTSLSVSGPPLALWLEARGVRPVEFRQTLAAAFLLLSVAGGAIVVTAEGIGPLDAEVVLPLLVCMLAGYALGAVAFRRLHTERFFVLALLLVIATGVASVLAGAVAL